MSYIARNMEEEVARDFLRKGVVLVGPRRAGKTTMVKKIGKEVGAEYVTFDDPDVVELFNSDIKEFSLQYEGKLLIIDEVHYGRDVGKKIKYLVDVEGRNVLLTGSNSSLVGEEVLPYLVGRVYIHRLYPFSLRELERAWPRQVTPQERIRIVHYYVQYGGYPEVFFSEDKEKELKSIVITAIEKEAVRSTELEPYEVWTVMKSIVASSGKINLNEVSKVVDRSVPAVKRVLQALERSFLLKRVRPFFRNPVKEITRMPRFYPLDPGVARLLGGNEGYAMETAVLSELLKAGIEEIRYWRTKDGAEVDFVVEGIPIEVKRTFTGGLPRGFVSFIKKYRPQRAVLVAMNVRKVEEREVEGVPVFMVPLWEIGSVITART